MADDRITAKMVAQWNPSSQYEAAKEATKDLPPDSVEYRLRRMEGALADMAAKLSGANAAYEACWKELRLYQEILKSWEKRFLTAEEHDLFVMCADILRSEGDDGKNTGG